MPFPPPLTNPGALTNLTPQLDLHKLIHTEDYQALLAIISQIQGDETLITANANAIAANAANIQALADSANTQINGLQAQIDALQAQIDNITGTPTPPTSGATVQLVGYPQAVLDKIIAARAAGSPTAEQTALKNLYSQFLASSVASKTSHPTAADITAIPTSVTSANRVAFESTPVLLADRCLAQAIRYYVEGDTQCRDNVISEVATAAGGVGYMASTGFQKITAFLPDSSDGNPKLDASWIAGPLATACALVAFKDDLDHPDPVTSPPVWTAARRQATRDWFWNVFYLGNANPPAAGGSTSILNHTSANNWLASMFHARVTIAGWLLSGSGTAGSSANGQAALQNAINWYRDMATWVLWLGIDAASAKAGNAGYPLFMNNSDPNNDTKLEKAEMWFFGDAKVGDVGFGGATVAGGSPYSMLLFDGMNQETARDLSHSLLTLGGLAYGLATCSILGTDIWDDTTNENGRRLRIGFEIAAGYVNEALDQFWNNTGTYPGGISDQSPPTSPSLATSTWTPAGGSSYGGTPNWVNQHLGTTAKNPAGGSQPGGSSINQQAAQFSMGGQAYVSGWQVAAYWLINVKGYHMPQLDRLRRRLLNIARTTNVTADTQLGSINQDASLDGVNSKDADPVGSFHFNLSLDGFPWYFAPHTVIAHDGFNRTVASGNWGTSDSTNQSGDTLPSFAWAMADDSAHPTKFSVDSVTGRARILISNATPAGETLPVNAADIDVTCRFDLDKLPTVGQASLPSLHLQGRRSGTTWYSAAVRVNPPSAAGQPSSLGLRLYASIAGVLTQLPNMGLTSQYTYTVGAGLWVRLCIKGTKIQMKAWVSAYDTPANEPAVWDLSATDTQISAAGAVGIYEAIAGTTDPGFPILFSSDHLHVKAPV